MLANNVVIKQVKKFPIYDVFHSEEGWEPDGWSRILIKNGKGILVSGAVLPISMLKAVVKRITAPKAS